jgi:hypothetical protein
MKFEARYTKESPEFLIIYNQSYYTEIVLQFLPQNRNHMQLWVSMHV